MVINISISQVIGCEDRLRNDLYCVEWGVKLYSNSNRVKLVAILVEKPSAPCLPERELLCGRIEKACANLLVNDTILDNQNNNNDRLTAFDPGQPG